MTIAAVITLFFSFLLLLFPPSTAEIKTLTITSDNRPVILLEKFGFTRTGHVSISVSRVSVAGPTSSEAEPSQLGFFLLSKESLLQVLVEIQQNPTFCVLHSRHTLHLCTFRVLSPPPSSSFNHTYPITTPNEYSLFFTNCNPDTAVSMSLRIELFNLNPTLTYLSSAHTHLPSLFFLFSVAYFSFFAFSLSLTKHLLIPSLLLANAINLLSAAALKHRLNLAGTPRASDHILFFLSRFARVVLLFAVVVLVGTRWTFLHPINRKGKTVLFFLIIPLQILAHVAFAVIDKTGPYIQNWVTWNQVFFLLDFISCCAVVVLFASAMLLLRRITSKAQKSEPAMNLDRFSLIRRFYLLVFGYMFFTQFVMLALKELIAYDYQWVSNLIEETVTLMFCFVVLYVFRLLEKDEYSVIGDVEEEEAAENTVKK